MKISELINRYLKSMAVRGRAKLTIRSAKYGLRDFNRFLEAEKIFDIEELTGEIMTEYQQELAFRLTARGTPLSLRSQSQMLAVTKNFTQFLKEADYLIHDPGDKIKLPKKPRPLPKVILSMPELEQVMKGPDSQTNQGYRNLVILEVLYDTGIRRAEVANLQLRDLDLDGGYIHIRSGKGDKDRVVPLSGRVSNLVRSYIEAVRASFIHGNDQGYLILNRWGDRMDGSGIWAAVKRSAHLSGIKKNITTHTFRHTCATHMLKHGAPIRHVQELLGHESLESTQIYTRVTINDLKEIHARCHPGESLSRR
jgi:integrase/recombinase XerD